VWLAPDERVRFIHLTPYATHAGRAVIGLQIQRDGANDYQRAMYTVEPDGSLVLRCREDQPQTVVIPDRPGGPFTIDSWGLAQFTPDGQAVFASWVANSAGELVFAALYTDEAGTIRPLFIEGDTLDLEPHALGGEVQLDDVSDVEVTPNGHVLLRLREAFSSTGVAVTATTSIVAPPCRADTNGDGLVNPADFSGWVIAFNNQTPACDQNGDGLCLPADFTGWVINYNAGC
ncbi:MAG: hypothetical protein AAFY46_12130, partial [Planctomycetota bacterium]